MENDTTTTPTPENSPASSDANLWCMLCHLSPLLMLIGVPFLNLVGPLLIWQIKKDEIPAVIEHGKESLNFQITATIVFLLLGFGVLAGFILTFVFIGFIILPVVGLLTLAAVIGWLVLVVLAAVAANEGKAYRYPWTLRLVK